MRKNSMKCVALLALLCGPALAVAAVQVRFVESDKFVDAGDVGRDREQILKDIQAYFVAQGDKLLPGKDLAIEVTEVDLAGHMRPVGPGMQMLRVLGSTGRPLISLRYVLSEGSTELRRKDVTMSSLDYLGGISRHDSGDSIRYEKQMIDAWFRSEFAVAK